MSVKLSELLSCALDAAERASVLIREVYSSKDLHVKFKTSVTDPVTIADVNSEKCISSMFRSKWFAFYYNLSSNSIKFI